jgi:AcrR family transcriptional regulator
VFIVTSSEGFAIMRGPNNLRESTLVAPDKKAMTREQILQSALTCFADKGYHQTTMDDIGAQSGLSKGSLYWHFKSKKELFIALLNWLMFDFLEEAFVCPDSISASEKIHTIAMHFVDRFEQIIPFTRVILDFWAQTFDDQQVQNMFDSLLQHFQDQLGLIIAEGIARGEFRAVNESQVALALMGMLDSLWLYSSLLEDRIDLRGTVETTLDILVAGLKSQQVTETES